jgi:hypothetical protein
MNITPKAATAKIVNWGYILYKNLCTAKEIIKQQGKQKAIYRRKCLQTIYLIWG